MFTRSALSGLIVFSVLMLSACGAEDDGAAVEVTDATNAEPRDAVRGPDAPEVGDASDAQQRIENSYAPQKDADAMAPVGETIRAKAEVAAASGSGVSGQLRFEQGSDFMHITGSLEGLTPGKHGLHVHVVGDCSAPDAASAKGHFAPDDDPHGAPQELASDHHVGDLGNITADESGVAEFRKTDAEMTLETGDYTIVDRAVIVHAQADNLVSQPSGDAGDRVGCGVVELDLSPADLQSRNAEESN